VILIGALLWFKRRNVFWRELLLLILILLIGGVLVQILKRMFGRLRPPMLFGPSVHTLGLMFYNASFPSGHTQTAFGAAVYMAYRFKRFWYAYFVIAALMGLSRIYVGAHFPIDVIAGAIIGSAIAVVCIKYNDRINSGNCS
jgi:undecaprenyl-diphosphatase